MRLCGARDTLIWYAGLNPLITASGELSFWISCRFIVDYSQTIYRWSSCSKNFGRKRFVHSTMLGNWVCRRFTSWCEGSCHIRWTVRRNITIRTEFQMVPGMRLMHSFNSHSGQATQWWSVCLLVFVLSSFLGTDWSSLILEPIQTFMSLSCHLFHCHLLPAKI